MDELSRGSCVGSGKHELFFSDRPHDLATAQSICAGCPAQIRCLENALENAVEWGVWGGVIFWDGQPYHRRRGRGRPRLGDTHAPLEADLGELRRAVRSA